MSLKIEFVKEDGTIFALAQNTMYKGKYYDEILFAEIESNVEGGMLIRWEDDYMTKVPATKDNYRELVLKDITNHKPHVNGASFDMEE